MTGFDWVLMATILFLLACTLSTWIICKRENNRLRRKLNAMNLQRAIDRQGIVYVLHKDGDLAKIQRTHTA